MSDDVSEWRCFHCDEVFTDEQEATVHFGPHEGYTALCVDKDIQERRQLEIELESARNREANQQDKLDGLEAHFAELKLYFGNDCTSVWLAGDRYRNVKFERDQAEAKIAELEKENGRLWEDNEYQREVFQAIKEAFDEEAHPYRGFFKLRAMLEAKGIYVENLGDTQCLADFLAAYVLPSPSSDAPTDMARLNFLESHTPTMVHWNDLSQWELTSEQGQYKAAFLRDAIDAALAEKEQPK